MMGHCGTSVTFPFVLTPSGSNRRAGNPNFNRKELMACGKRTVQDSKRVRRGTDERQTPKAQVETHIVR